MDLTLEVAEKWLEMHKPTYQIREITTDIDGKLVPGRVIETVYDAKTACAIVTNHTHNGYMTTISVK